MDFFYTDDNQLMMTYGNQSYAVNTSGSNTFTIDGMIYMYKYQEGLLVSSVTVSINDDVETSYSEVCEFQEGMLRSRYINGTMEHYFHNVYLGSSTLGTNTEINIRNRVRCIIEHTEEQVNYDMIDDNFFWLLQINPNYRETVYRNVPFTFAGYMKFYSMTPSIPHDIQHHQKEGVSWKTIDGHIDLTVTFGTNYIASVTNSFLEEERINEFRYVYGKGKILQQVTIDDVQQNLIGGYLNTDDYLDGFITIGSTIIDQHIDSIRPNIPYSDPEDTIRTHVRKIIPFHLYR